MPSREKTTTMYPKPKRKPRNLKEYVTWTNDERFQLIDARSKLNHLFLSKNSNEIGNAWKQVVRTAELNKNKDTKHCRQQWRSLMGKYAEFLKSSVEKNNENNENDDADAQAGATDPEDWMFFDAMYKFISKNPMTNDVAQEEVEKPPSFELSDKIFVQAVERRPPIYDFHCQGYRNNTVRRALWTEIINEMVHNGLPAISIEQCKMHWKKIRYKYKKRKLKKTNYPLEEWGLEEYLSFLDPFILTQNRSLVVTDFESVNFNGNSMANSPIEIGSDSSSDHSILNGRSEFESNMGQSQYMQKPTNNLEPLLSNLLTRMKQKQNPIKMYCLSLIPSLQRMSARHLDRLKLQIQKLIVESHDH